MSAWTLTRGDCLEPSTGLPICADKSIDVVMTDPPYSEHVHGKSMRGLTVTHVAGAEDEFAERRDLGFDSLTTDVMEACADQFARICRRWVLVFCDVESSHLWAGALRSAGLEYLRTMAWIKIGGAPQFTGDRPAVGFEAIVVAHPKGKKQWNGGGKAGIYSIPTAIDRDRSGLDERCHTTQKPVALMEALVRDFTNPGKLICDPFAGSGTTGLAALRLGRRFVGWEQDASNYETAMRRLSSAHAEPEPLFRAAKRAAKQEVLL